MLSKRQLLTISLLVFPGALLAFAALQFEYFSWDLWLTRWFQSFRHPVLRGWMRYVSWIGQGTAHNVGMYGAALLAFSAFGRKREGLFCVLAAGVAHALSGAFKVAIGRPRPQASLVEVLFEYTSKSFPSGHVLSFVGFYGILIYFSFKLVKPAGWRAFLVTVFGAMIASVGPSRIYVGAHWPSDVLGGYILGGAWLLLAIALYERSLKGRGQLAKS